MPIVNGQYQAPTWVNGQRPPINAEELQAISDSIVNNQTNIASANNVLGKIIFSNFYTENPPYFSLADPLSVARYVLAGTANSKYAIFAGGSTGGSSYVATTDAYDESLTHTTPDPLSTARMNIGSANVGSYALFAGGTGAVSTVDAYDESLTHTNPTSLSVERSSLAGASIGNYALFAGGSNTYTNVDAYDSSLTRTTPDPLSVGRGNLGGISNSNYAIFGGGFASSATSTVDAYDESLTHTTPTTLSVARYNMATANVGVYALFAGGTGASSPVVDAYDASLTRTTPNPLSGTNISSSAGASTTDMAIFFGNVNNTDITIYDESLSQTILENPGTSSANLAATSFGKYMIFAGGNISGGYTDDVNVFQNEVGYSITIPAMTAYNFDESEEDTFTFSEVQLQGAGMLSGYIKYYATLSGYYSQN